MSYVEDTRPEFITCSCIWVDTGTPVYMTRNDRKVPYRPHRNYPKTGYLFSGLRHADCSFTIQAWIEQFPPEERARLMERRTQGFLTNRGRFVDRKEALKIAMAAEQLKWRGNKPITPRELYSEDLY